MKRLHVLASCLAYCSLIGFSITACQPASYEIIPGEKDKKADDSGDPNEFGTGPTDPTPTDPGDSGNVTPPIGTNYPPTARVEAVFNGKAVTKIKVGSPVQIQPTFDTVDPDDVGISACRNPGIVSATYQGAGSDEKAVVRNDGCESLHVAHTFDVVGEYLIEMTVTSNENETAKASMTLTVLPATADDWDRGGFTIAAKPMIVTIGQNIDFTGHCETDTRNVITWAFGDEATGDGRIVAHAYGAEGQYQVDALCVDEEGNERDARLTIVVIDRTITPPGNETPGTPTKTEPDPSIPDPDDGGGDDGDPGEPGQGEPGQGQPDQNFPDQDRNCYCTL